jgi:F-type H+-transporting ATPase subunit a
MLNVFFIAETEPLAAQKIFEIGPLAITNSMMFGLVMAAVTLGILWLAASRSRVNPKYKLAYYVETLVDAIFGVALDSFNNRKTAFKHLPFLVTLFVFILICNLSGLLPGVGTIHTSVNGQEVPLLRAFTTDLNATLALALLTIGLVQFYAIRELGILGHLKHYFSSEPWKPINLFIGVNEVFGELLKIITLSMRLFGVIYAGEVLIFAIAQLSGNFAWFATVPAVLLEVFFSVVQAYVFMMLTTTYLAIATSTGEHGESDGSKKNVKLQTAT